MTRRVQGAAPCQSRQQQTSGQETPHLRPQGAAGSSQTGAAAEAPPFPPAQGILGAEVPVAFSGRPFATPRQTRRAATPTPGALPSLVALARGAAREDGQPLGSASRGCCGRPRGGLQFPGCLVCQARPGAFVLRAPRGSVGAVVRTRDSQRRVRPGLAVAAGPRPGATLRRRRRAGAGRGLGSAGSGRSAAPPLSAEGQRCGAAGGRSCGAAGGGERARAGRRPRRQGRRDGGRAAGLRR